MDSIINHVAAPCGSPRHTATFYQSGGAVGHRLSDLDRLARRTAAWLRSLGLTPGDRIGIVARNCLEWVLLDLAALKLKVMTAGFEAGKFAPGPGLLADYGLKLIFTDQESGDPRIRNIREISEAIAGSPDPAPAAVVWRPDETTTIKFTSGSTGRPKGLAATVGSIDSSLHAVQDMFQHRDGDKLLVFLPLSLLQQRYWIYSALRYGHDVVVSTYELAFLAIRREHPTVIMGVPGFFDAVKKQIESRARDSARSGNTEGRRLRQAAQEVLGPRIRYLWTGSAPANPATLRFLTDCGLAIYEGYGMNETCIVTKNHPGAERLGSVGRPVAGKRIRIGSDNVVIVSSRYPVNTRYLYCAPGESEKIFLPNGDVRTGDLGYLDADGYLYITGRADDIVVLGNGKNVMVRAIEERLKTSAAIADCVLFGSGRPYLVAVVAAADGRAGETEIASHIDQVNRDLAADERIGRFVLSDEQFTIENGLLTSQYKPRRKEIFNRYKAQIERAYGATA